MDSDSRQNALNKLNEAIELCARFDLPTPFVATSGPAGGNDVAALIESGAFNRQFVAVLAVSDIAAYYELEREYLTPRGGKFLPLKVGFAQIATMGDDVFIRQEDDDVHDSNAARDRAYRVMEELKPVITPVGMKRYADHRASEDQRIAVIRFLSEQCTRDLQAPRLYGPDFMRAMNNWLVSENLDYLMFSIDANARQFYNVLRETFASNEWNGAYVDARPNRTDVRGVRLRFKETGISPAGGSRRPSMKDRMIELLEGQYPKFTTPRQMRTLLDNEFMDYAPHSLATIQVQMSMLCRNGILDNARGVGYRLAQR